MHHIERIDSLKKAIQERILLLDGAMGTILQTKNLSAADFGGDTLEGCNENLVLTRPDLIQKIHESYLEAGSDIIEVHYEAEHDLGQTLSLIRDSGAKAALAINPPTPIDKAFPFLDKIDMLLVMSVNPGFGGQSFMPEVLPKIGRAKEEMARQGLRVPIEIDGGITDVTGEQAARAGADILAAGTYVFKAQDMRAAVERLRACGSSKD